MNRLSDSEIDLKQILDRIRILADKIHQSLEVSEILKIIVKEVRKSFKATWVERYRDGCIGVIEDIDTTTIDPCYKKLLTDLQIRANLVVPIGSNAKM
ncbi:hypothetical protein [Nostoc sp. C117]|uniref:hypothetical protein n=1 Tax=Nostoc sp. C117 TaxID=3349875 RepID=UPI00370D534E